MKETSNSEGNNPKLSSCSLRKVLKAFLNLVCILIVQMGGVSSALFNKQHDKEGLCGVVLDTWSWSGVKATPLLQEGLSLACLGHIHPPW